MRRATGGDAPRAGALCSRAVLVNCSQVQSSLSRGYNYPPPAQLDMTQATQRGLSDNLVREELSRARLVLCKSS